MFVCVCVLDICGWGSVCTCIDQINHPEKSPSPHEAARYWQINPFSNAGSVINRRHIVCAGWAAAAAAAYRLTSDLSEVRENLLWLISQVKNNPHVCVISVTAVSAFEREKT